jgi:type IV pilus assembly protein PilB
MPALTEEIQVELEKLLVEEKVLSPAQIEEHRKVAKTSGTPLFSELVQSAAVSDEELTRLIAKVSNVPYVDLSNALIEQSVLLLLPQEVAERYMAVPLGKLG